MRKQFIKMPIIYHVIAAILFFCILAYIVLKILNVYTRHNEAVVVPDIKGLQIEEAVHFLENNTLRYQIIDSVYTNDVKPGAIVEVSPTVGAKVKEGRIISVTLNAKSVQKAAMPDVKDLSFRQALALIQSRGFTSVETKYIPGRFRDLVIGVELNGMDLAPGEQIPLTSTLILKVSDGGQEESADDSDSSRLGMSQPARDSESWF